MRLVWLCCGVGRCEGRAVVGVGEREGGAGCVVGCGAAAIHCGGPSTDCAARTSKQRTAVHSLSIAREGARGWPLASC